jgi:hypothetical protein
MDFTGNRECPHRDSVFVSFAWKYQPLGAPECNGTRPIQSKYGIWKRQLFFYVLFELMSRSFGTNNYKAEIIWRLLFLYITTNEYQKFTHIHFNTLNAKWRLLFINITYRAGSRGTKGNVAFITTAVRKHNYCCLSQLVSLLPRFNCSTICKQPARKWSPNFSIPAC